MDLPSGNDPRCKRAHGCGAPYPGQAASGQPGFPNSPGFILIVDHKKLADVEELKAGSQRAVCSPLFRAVKFLRTEKETYFPSVRNCLRLVAVILDRANSYHSHAALSTMYKFKKPPPNIKTVSIEHFLCTFLDTGDVELAEQGYLAPAVYNPVIDLDK
ncbi:hypothetical protein STEG23_022711 [Scotinomys teguina]